jgi:plasmid maintenance system antidote protein VapI
MLIMNETRKTIKRKPTPHEVKKLLKRNKLSLYSLSDYLDLSYNHTCNIVNGKQPLTPENQKKMAEFINELKDPFRRTR